MVSELTLNSLEEPAWGLLFYRHGNGCVPSGSPSVRVSQNLLPLQFEGKKVSKGMVIGTIRYLRVPLRILGSSHRALPSDLREATSLADPTRMQDFIPAFHCWWWYHGVVTGLKIWSYFAPSCRNFGSSDHDIVLPELISFVLCVISSKSLHWCLSVMDIWNWLLEGS